MDMVPDDRAKHTDDYMTISIVYRKLHRTNVAPAMDDSPDSVLSYRSSDSLLGSIRNIRSEEYPVNSNVSQSFAV